MLYPLSYEGASGSLPGRPTTGDGWVVTRLGVGRCTGGEYRGPATAAVRAKWGYPVFSGSVP